MDTTTAVTAVLALIAGIGVFLIACSMVSSNIESLSGSKLRRLFEKTSDNKLAGVGIGAATTAAIQSSGATTVMIIGFVNAGMISLGLAAAMIYGANIGTTITAQIVALGMFGQNTVSLSAIFAALAGVGAFINIFAKKDKTKKIGGILTGFGLLFVGLILMTDSMTEVAKDQAVQDFLSNIDNVMLILLIGILLTALVQSSSVITSLAIAMLFAGLIDLEQGIYLTMGSNIGSCVVAIMAGFTSGKNAKRTALIHLLFNVTGVIIFVIAGFIITGVGGPSYSDMFEFMFPGAPETQLAMFHTFFNVVAVIIMLPLTGMLIKLVTRIVPDKPDDEKENNVPHMYFINSYMLRTPPIAVQQIKKEIINMARIAEENFNLSCYMISTKDLTDIEKFRNNENQLNYLNKGIVHYLVKLSSMDLSAKDSLYISTAYHSVTDLERIGDYAENIVEYTERFIENGESFSEFAIADIEKVRLLIQDLYESVMESYTKVDLEELKHAFEIEEQIDIVTDKMVDDHIERLNNGTCTAGVGAEYLLLVSNAERIADHFMNVGKTIREYA
ncbi:MAG: Na/Pi cotransporter family protein [Candidatus Methanomethylophilaceae archaeon]|nr:Na/Pi cotransporter family protein [Candidatus Methanomethylophilaceae archaeon]